MKPEQAEQEQQLQCPQCKEPLQVLLFMGTEPDGFVCPKCEVWYSDKLQPLAKVLRYEA
jgi:hypothetical protein